jgi:hypothetical protein
VRAREVREREDKKLSGSTLVKPDCLSHVVNTIKFPLTQNKIIECAHAPKIMQLNLKINVCVGLFRMTTLDYYIIHS